MPTAEMELEPAAIPGEEIEQLLARILDSHHFRHSARYPALLKYLVEQTLHGKSAQLKERLLGIEVFHRAPEYDTNSDPVVRVTAAEVRKRIAQYYQEPDHTDEIRIEIPLGSYVPRFSRPLSTSGRTVAAQDSPETSPEPPGEADDQTTAVRTAHAAEISGKSGWPLGRWLGIPVALCTGVLLTLGAVRLSSAVIAHREAAVRGFWAPLANTTTPIFIVMGSHTVGTEGNALRANQGAAVNPSEAVLQVMNEHEQLTLNDTTSLFKIIGYMTRHNQSYRAAGAGSVSLADLGDGPAILFAGLDNRWTMRLTEHLRYRFVDSPINTIGIIEDTKNPSQRWMVDFNVPYSKMPMDYAIVGRYFDPLIEQPVMIAAGIGETGTVSAGEFVTNERLIEDLNKLAPAGWKPGGNVEAVLATPVIDGHPGPPHIVASYFW